MTGYAQPMAQERGEVMIGRMAALIIVAATSFNFVLALINQHVMGIGGAHVMAAEGMILIAVHALVLFNFREGLRPWYTLIWLVTGIAMARWAWTGHVDPKGLRDMLIIPTFIALGVVASRTSLNRLVIGLQLVIFIVAMFELFATDLYSSMVGVRQYYINTRGVDEASFWNTSSELFISATRPQERFAFGFLGNHRVSSIFLEPVSLGNYAIIISAFICARFRQLSWREIAFLAVTNFGLIVACDGRLALVSSFAILVIAVMAPHIPRLGVLYPLGVIGLAFVLLNVIGITAGTDDFPGRVASTAKFLQNMSWREYFGVGGAEPPGLPDSGIAYVVFTQSFVCALVMWFFINAFLKENTAEQARMKHTMLIYFVLTMTVSNSFLSIKTAALAWFLLGFVQFAPRGERNSGLEIAGMARSLRGNQGAAAVPGAA